MPPRRGAAARHPLGLAFSCAISAPCACMARSICARRSLIADRSGGGERFARRGFDVVDERRRVSPTARAPRQVRCATRQTISPAPRSAPRRLHPARGGGAGVIGFGLDAGDAGGETVDRGGLTWRSRPARARPSQEPGRADHQRRRAGAGERGREDHVRKSPIREGRGRDQDSRMAAVGSACGARRTTSVA